MKMLKKLSNWKTWVFFILPLLMLLSNFGILIYEAATKSYNASLIVLAEILLIIGVVLFFCNNIFYRIRQKSLVRGIAAILFAVCFICLRVAFVVKSPEYCNVSIEYEKQYEEWKDIPYENKDEFREKYDALQQVRDLQRDLGFTLEFLHIGSLGALSFMAFCVGNPKKENSEKDEDKATE
ncbi:MAG: hypothetical protein J1F36_02910 [Clostridiales bacterium]|nr:hypothetical protein [Clostridiales bacterium]